MTLYERPGDDISKGLIGYWKLDDLKSDPSVSVTVDQINFVDGTIAGAIGAPDINGVTNNAILFDGTDDSISIPHNANQLGTNLLNGFTISAWINPTSIGEIEGRIVDKSTSSAGQNGFSFKLASTNKVSLLLNDGTPKVSTDAITYGIWTHVLVTVSSGQLANIYLNGVISGSANQDLVQKISTITTTNAMVIGGRSGASDRTFDGSIANVRFYNRELTPGEATKLYRLRK